MTLSHLEIPSPLKWQQYSDKNFLALRFDLVLWGTFTEDLQFPGVKGWSLELAKMRRMQKIGSCISSV